MRMRHFLPLFTLLLWSADAQVNPASPENIQPGPDEFNYAPHTLVLYRAKDEDSKMLASYYAEKRRIPEQNLIPLDCPAQETISREDYVRTIEEPLRTELTKRGMWKLGKVENQGTVPVQTTVRVMTIIRGIPLRVNEQPVVEKDPSTGKEEVIAPKAGESNASSVDSELAALGLLDKTIRGPLKNPYHKQNVSFSRFPWPPMFITGRIDGPSVTVAKRLIDDAIATEKAGGLFGRAVVDLALKPGAYEEGDNWLMAVARACELKGIPVSLDSLDVTLPRNWPATECALYYGWYTETADGPFLNPGFSFRRGAVACHIHSFSATSLQTTTGWWCGPLLSKGACGVLGNTWEPFLSLCAHLDVFNESLLAGYTFGEAASQAMPVLSWMSTAVGDPLYRPFPMKLPKTSAPEDRDYLALRVAMQRWGTEEAALMENLGNAAAKLKSGRIYEFMALHAQAGEGDAAKRSAPHFENALKAYTEPADKIRILLLTADALRRSDEKKAAVKLLNKAAETYPKAPETEAVKAMSGLLSK